MATPLMADVTVNGVAIAATLIAAEAQNHPAPAGKPGLAWRAAARALALREALVQEARALGLQPDPAELEPGRIETEDEALVRALIEREVTPEPVDDAALRAHYDAHPDKFRSPPLWQAAHILLPADAGQLAEALLADLNAAPARFAALAEQHSLCSSKASGGLLGQIGPGDTVPEFEAALRALTPGQIAATPVNTRFGLHLVRLDEAAEGAVLPFASVLPRLQAAAEKAAWVRAAQVYAEQVLARARITGLVA